jgi:YesN/AraC family two-component response regulator
MEGLALAGSISPNLIVLDLRLPDVDGITFLRRLLAIEDPVPVVVLTGYPDEASQNDVSALGRVTYLQKPVIGQQLVSFLRNAMSMPQTARIGASTSMLGSVDPLAEESAAARQLLVTLDEFRLQASDGRRSGTLTRALLKVLLEERVQVPLFLACCRVFRTVAISSAEPQDELYAVCHEQISQSMKPFRNRNAQVAGAIQELEAAWPDCHQIHSGTLARKLGLSAAHFGRLLHRETGCRFRDWRTGILVRRAVHWVGRSGEQFAQISFKFGYESASHLNHDFRRLLGLSPTQFRRLVRDCALE